MTLDDFGRQPLLEVGIPTNNSLSVILETSLRALNLPGVASVHVSVNRLLSPDEFQQILALDSRIRITHREGNLGLYGNFRFLVLSCQADYLALVADDDCPSEEAFQSFLCLDLEQRRGKKLFIQKYVLQECAFNPTRWFGEIHQGREFDTSSTLTFHKLILNPEPSWIFGIWDSAYLRQIFPKRNFDWLDSYLLGRAISQNVVLSLHNLEPQIIGTWKWLGKEPTSVNGKFHSGFGWLSYFLLFALKSKLIVSLRWSEVWKSGIQPRFRYASSSKKKYLESRV